MELLAVIAVIAALAAIILPVVSAMQRRGHQTAGLSNMRQVGMAFILYAAEHDYQLPGRTTGQNGQDRWPKVLMPYIKDVRIYAAPGDPQNYLHRNADPLSNERNNTSYIMNGYNDRGTISDPNVEVRLNQFQSTVNTLLLGTPKAGSIHFFMDFAEPPHGNHKDILNLEAYGDGSNYFFADGSARFIAKKDYDDKLWLSDKTSEIPSL